MDITRRRFLSVSSALGLSTLLPACSLIRTDQERYVYELTAEASSAEIVPGYITPVLGFNGSIQIGRASCRERVFSSV